MKLLTLNTWGGRAGQELVLDFFKKYKDTDIFCLQEIWSAPYDSYEGREAGGVSLSQENVMTNGKQKIEELLSDHRAFFCPLVFNDYGLEVLVKDNLMIKEDGEVYVYKHKGYIGKEDMGDHGRPLQYVTLDLPTGLLTIINFHGLWAPEFKSKPYSKIDTPDRIAQSERIVEFVSSLGNEFIIAGDFNLMPDTESTAILEKAGLINLVKKFDITSTRTPLYDKTEERYADYVFVSKGVNVQEFKVLPDVVSDHSALYLDFML